MAAVPGLVGDLAGAGGFGTVGVSPWNRVLSEAAGVFGVLRWAKMGLSGRRAAVIAVGGGIG